MSGALGTRGGPGQLPASDHHGIRNHSSKGPLGVQSVRLLRRRLIAKASYEASRSRGQFALPSLLTCATATPGRPETSLVRSGISEVMISTEAARSAASACSAASTAVAATIASTACADDISAAPINRPARRPIASPFIDDASTGQAQRTPESQHPDGIAHPGRPAVRAAGLVNRTETEGHRIGTQEGVRPSSRTLLSC